MGGHRGGGMGIAPQKHRYFAPEIFGSRRRDWDPRESLFPKTNFYSWIPRYRLLSFRRVSKQSGR
jgi:hypothetical protein